MKQLTSIELLDEVLGLFNSSSKFIGTHRIQISDLIRAKNFDVDYGLLTEILVKLEKDGYLRLYLGDVQLPNQKLKDVPFYVLTIEGELFIEKGKYTQKMINDDRNESRRWSNDYWLIRGTWAAGIAGIFLFLMEVVKFFFRH